MKKNLLLFLLIIIVFFFLQHRAAPNVPMPAKYQATSQNIQVQARLGIPQGSSEVWTVAKKNDTTYIINVYNNSKLIHSFFTAKAILHDTSGTTFGTGGNILFDGSPYTAKTIHIDKSGKTGSILFTPETKPTENRANGTNQS
jgi:hypothetical protein